MKISTPGLAGKKPKIGLTTYLSLKKNLVQKEKIRMNEDYQFQNAIPARDALEKQRKAALKEAVGNYFQELIGEIKKEDPTKLRALLDFFSGKVTRWSSRNLLAIRVQKPDIQRAVTARSQRLKQKSWAMCRSAERARHLFGFLSSKGDRNIAATNLPLSGRSNGRRRRVSISGMLPTSSTSMKRGKLSRSRRSAKMPSFL